MTREQAKANLVGFGIAEPTEEQITNYLNQIGNETKKERDRADKYKADSERVSELQKQLEDINNQNLTDVEKANKSAEEANKRAEAAEKLVKQMQFRNKLAEKGIIGEDADKLFSEDGALDIDFLGEIISNREKKAVSEFEKQCMANTINANGGAGNNEQKSEAEQIAESLNNVGSINTGNVIDNYLKP